MKNKLIINFSSKNYIFKKKDKKKLKDILKAVSFMKNENYKLSLFFVGRRKIKELNFKYRFKNKTTDILSFPFHFLYSKEIFLEEKVIDLGDIFICYPLSLIQAKGKNLSFQKEINFLFLHGLLHLLGYDHEKKKERKKMFDLKKEILNKLK